MAEKARPKLKPRQLRKLFAMGLLSIKGSGKDRKVAYDKAKAASMKKGGTAGGSSQATPPRSRVEILKSRAARVREYMSKTQDPARRAKAETTSGRILRALGSAQYDEAKAAKRAARAANPEMASPKDALLDRRKTLGNRAAVVRQYAQKLPRGSERQAKVDRIAAALDRRIKRTDAKLSWAGLTPQERAERRSTVISDINAGFGSARIARGTRSIPAGVRVTATKTGTVLNPAGVSVRAPYNQGFIAAAKALGGKWDSYEKTWTFSKPEAKKKVASLVRQYYGRK